MTMRQFAFLALIGVGDASRGEWEEWTGRAYHVRRRLSAAEQASVGDAVDIRGTAEAVKRLHRVFPYASMSPQGLAVLEAELIGGAVADAQ